MYLYSSFVFYIPLIINLIKFIIFSLSIYIYLYAYTRINVHKNGQRKIINSIIHLEHKERIKVDLDYLDSQIKKKNKVYHFTLLFVKPKHIIKNSKTK